jgi:CRP/FNR family transcriptional regulator
MHFEFAAIDRTVHRIASGDTIWSVGNGRQPGPAPGSKKAGRIAEMLSLLVDSLPIRRRVLGVGDQIYGAGDPLVYLYVLHAGTVKVVNASADGRGQIVSLNFRGDWLGFDGIATGRYACAAVALDVGEVWALRYDELLAACAARPRLLNALHGEMSRSLTRSLGAMLTLRTRSAVSRVASFLFHWADSLAERGQRSDQIVLRMTRAEIGDYLGMTLESVSRGLSALARNKVIGFDQRRRRDILILDLPALTHFTCSRGDPQRSSGRPDDKLVNRHQRAVMDSGMDL